MRDRNKSTTSNVVFTLFAAIFSQVVNMVVALLLPRLMILTYGSDFNGIVSASRQFANYLAMIDSGMYAATCYQFIKAYKNNDLNTVNTLFSTVGSFFRKTAYCVAALTVILSASYGILTKSTVPYFDIIYIFFMYSLGTIIAYYAFFKYNLVLFCNGKQYYITNVCAVFALISLAGQWITIKLGCNIFIIIAIYPLCIILRLLVLKNKTKKEYPYLDSGVQSNPKLISQKWDSLVLNIADNMKTFAPIISISWIFGSALVSVYTTYETVLHLGSSVLITVLNGLVPTIGKDLTDSDSNSKHKFRLITIIIYIVSGVISICFSFMIINFINIYIGNKADIRYSYPCLAYLMIISVWFLMVRTSFDLLIKANGFIKELRKGAVIEIALALSLCLIIGFANKFEIIPLGVVISTAYRTTRMCLFCSKRMKFDESNYLLIDEIKWFIVISLSSLLCIAFAPSTDSIIQFVVFAVFILAISITACTVIVYFGYREYFYELKGLLVSKIHSIWR